MIVTLYSDLRDLTGRQTYIILVFASVLGGSWIADKARGSVSKRSFKAARASETLNDRRCYEVLASMTVTESGSAR